MYAIRSYYGVVMNTGLGRAPLSEKAIEKAHEILSGYCSLEVDIRSGKRGRREDKISELISLITGAEAATVVNNNAAAVMICINTLSRITSYNVCYTKLLRIPVGSLSFKAQFYRRTAY